LSVCSKSCLVTETYASNSECAKKSLIMKQTRGICVSVGVVVLTLDDEIYFYVYIYVAYLTEPSFKNISNEWCIYLVKHWFCSVPQRISLTSQQLIVRHSIRQTEIPALVDSWVKNTLSVKISCPQNSFSFIFVNT